MKGVPIFNPHHLPCSWSTAKSVVTDKDWWPPVPAAGVATAAPVAAANKAAAPSSGWTAALLSTRMLLSQMHSSFPPTLEE